MDREECERSEQGKKVAEGRCGQAIETKSPRGHTHTSRTGRGAPIMGTGGMPVVASVLGGLKSTGVAAIVGTGPGSRRTTADLDPHRSHR